MTEKLREEEWRTIARQVLKEQNSEKIVALAQQIIEAYQGETRKRPRSVSAATT
jgi:hypothetical protein